MAIIEKGKDKYQLVYDYYENGKRKRKTKVVNCGIREAKKLYAEFCNECATNKYYKPVTVEKLLNDYIDDCELRGLSANTIRGYRMAAKRLILAFGDTFATELTPYQINEFVRSQAKISKSKTIRNSTSLLTSAYNYAIGLELLGSSPCNHIRLPKNDSNEKVILNETEIKRFVECLDNEPQDVKVAYLLALFGGLRKGEIQGLKEPDIGFDFNTVKIDRTRYDDVIQPPKTNTSKRTMRLPSWVMSEVKILMDQHENHEWLIQYCHEPIGDWYLDDRMRRFKEKYDFDITLHGLRHTFASMLIASGEFDIVEVSKLMGHSNVGVTLNVYAHLFESSVHSAKRAADFNEKFGTDLAQRGLKAL